MDQLLVTDGGSDQTVTCTTVPRLMVGGGGLQSIGRDVGVLSMVGACLSVVMSVNFLDLLQLNRYLLRL